MFSKCVIRRVLHPSLHQCAGCDAACCRTQKPPPCSWRRPRRRPAPTLFLETPSPPPCTHLVLGDTLATALHPPCSWRRLRRRPAPTLFLETPSPPPCTHLVLGDALAVALHPPCSWRRPRRRPAPTLFLETPSPPPCTVISPSWYVFSRWIASDRCRSSLCTCWPAMRCS